MKKRQERIVRLRDVVQEYLVAVIATDLLEMELQADPSFLSSRELRQRDARNLRANLEATYLIRLFAEFEAGLRDAWKKAFGQGTQPPMRDLIQAIAARGDIPQEWLKQVDNVREYRNSLIHEEAQKVEVVSLIESRHRLCRFFSRLPLDW